MNLKTVLIQLTVSFIYVSFLMSCGIGRCDAIGPVEVYKTKGEYSNLITVNLSRDGKKITARPGENYVQNQRPIPLANGYLKKRMAGNVFLSITIDEFSNPNNHYSEEDLLNAVLDKDPYTEYYSICGCLVEGDTAEINNIIREGKLSDCR